MLQELVVYRCAVAHNQKLRCRSLVEVPITLLKITEEDCDIFNGCKEVFGNLPVSKDFLSLPLHSMLTLM